MGRLRQFLGLEESATVTEALAAKAAAENQVEVLAESMVDLELALEDRGWQRLTTAGDREFSREGLQRAANTARVMAVANPLIKRGLGVRQSYVWGSGVQIQARSTGDEGTQDVNAVVQAFLDDPGNRASFTGDQAHEENERALGTDGNVHVALFTNPRTGFVQVRAVPFNEIQDVILNPEDRDDPWYYKRVWTQTEITLDGRTNTVEKTVYHPALTFTGTARHKVIDGHKVEWDAPILQVSVNRLDGWKFGIGDAYAALSWARMYRDFLGDWATLVKALSQFAWKATSGSGAKSQKLRAALQRTTAPVVGNENTVGGTAVLGPDVNLEAIPKTGATIDSESGRPLAAMVAAALGIPVTMLLADPGQTGARAVAETLDKPTANEMNMRRALWAEAYRAILGYVIKKSVIAPQGPLRGTIVRDPYTGREVLTLAGDTDPTIEIVFPPIEDTDPAVIVKAIVEAEGTKLLPPVEVVKLLLAALGVEDVDEIVDDLTDDEGNFLDPYRDVGQNVGNAVTRAFRRGDDPVTADPAATPDEE